MGVATRADYGGVYEQTVNVNLPSVGAATSVTVAVTVPGLKANDRVLSVLPPSGLNAGLVIIAGSDQPAAGQVNVRVINSTAGAIDAAALDFVLVIGRK